MLGNAHASGFHEDRKHIMRSTADFIPSVVSSSQNIYGGQDVGWQEQGHHAGGLALLVGQEGVLSHM